MAVIEREFGDCVALVYGLRREGNFRSVGFYRIHSEDVIALEHIDPSDLLQPVNPSAVSGAVPIDLDLLPDTETSPRSLEDHRGKLQSAFFIPIHRTGLLVGFMLLGFFPGSWRDSNKGACVQNFGLLRLSHNW
jgi:hypothetical protein